MTFVDDLIGIALLGHSYALPVTLTGDWGKIGSANGVLRIQLSSLNKTYALATTSRPFPFMGKTAKGRNQWLYPPFASEGRAIRRWMVEGKELIFHPPSVWVDGMPDKIVTVSRYPFPWFGTGLDDYSGS